MPGVGKSNVFKVNVGWGLLIVAGISSFVVAKTLVTSQRVDNMRRRQEIKEQVEREIEAGK